MIDRIAAAGRRALATLWGWISAPFRAAATPERIAFEPVERPEPRGVVGITFRATMVVVAVALALVLAYQLRLLLILAFLALLVAAALHGPVVGFERRGLPRIVAVLATYAILIAVFIVALLLIFPPLINQAVDLVEDLPALVEQSRQSLVDLIDGIAGAGTGDRIVDALTRGAQEASPDVGTLLQLPLTAAGIIVNVLVSFLLSALMLIERDAVRHWAMQFVHAADREPVLGVARTALLKLGAYVRGQLVIMGVIGVGSFLGMVVVGMFTISAPIPFAVPLGALSFIGAAIPMAGAFLAGGPIVLIALLQSPITGLFMLLWLVGLQQLEGYVITPIIQGRAVQLSAMAVLLAVLSGAALGGIVGAIMAIPVVAVVDVVLRDVVIPLRRRADERRSSAHPDGAGL